MGKHLCRPEGHAGVVSQVPSAFLAGTRSLADLELARLQGQANPKELFASALGLQVCTTRLALKIQVLEIKLRSSSTLLSERSVSPGPRIISRDLPGWLPMCMF